MFANHKTVWITLLTITAVFGSSIYTDTAQAWGERGHHSVCFVATRLVKNPQLKSFLKSRGDLMGHVCNLPDISWRDMGPVAESGNAAHFINPQNVGLEITSLPTDYDAIYAAYQGQPSEALGREINVSEDLGSLWWRVNQFAQRAIAFGKESIGQKVDSIHALAQPIMRLNFGSVAEEQMDPSTRAVFKMMVSMGLMGHFVGDASQPLHNNADYDGWKVGHGGLHSYYETMVVNEMGLDLDQQVLDAANAMNFDISGESLIEAARSVSLVGASDYDALIAADIVSKPSEVIQPDPKEPNAIPKKVFARRPHPSERVTAFSPLILKEMATSARVLAQLWDHIVSESGEVPLSTYRSYLYPMNTEFVAPDYLRSEKTGK